MHLGIWKKVIFNARVDTGGAKELKPIQIRFKSYGRCVGNPPWQKTMRWLEIC